MTCPDHGDRTAEFALGLLVGDERAAMIAHLETCAACRNEVRALSETADELVAAAPEHDPPAGFEHRVLAALPPRPRRLRLRSPRVLAAVAAAFLIGLGIPIAVDATRSAPIAQVEQAMLRDKSGAIVGAAALEHRNGGYLDMSLSDTPDAEYTCLVVLRDGSTRVVGHLPKGGDGWWGGPLHGVDPDQVAAIRIVEGGGTPVAWGRMPLAS